MPDGKTLYVILSANASAYKAALRGASGDTREFGREVDKVGKDLDRMDAKTQKSGNAIDKMSGRLRLMLDALLLIGPGVTPIGAVAIPALTSLAGAGIIAGASLGAVAVGFLGITKVMEAANKAALEPTADNLAEYHRLMSNLPASTRAFVNELQSMKDVGVELRNASANGFMPHAVDSLEQLRTIAPQVEDTLWNMADAAGEQAEKIVGGLSGDNGQEFLAFINREARPTLDTLTDILMDVGAGLGDMWQAFDPLNDDALGWLEGATQDFREWSAELADSEGFAEFSDYVRTSGPQVADALGSIVDMFVEVVEATAPIGGPVLESLTAIADVIGAVADSDLGTPLLQGLAVVTLLNRGLGVTTSLLTKMGVEGAAIGGRAGLAAGFTAVQTKAASARTSVRSLGRDIGSMIVPVSATERALQKANSGLDRQAAATRRVQSTMRGYAGTVGKGALAAGALALATTDVGDEMGLSNTAMGGMVGMVLGPWGAAVGAGVGLIKDFADAGDDFNASMQSIQHALDAGVSGFGQARAEIAAAGKDINASIEEFNNPNLTTGFSTGYWAEVWQHIGDGGQMYRDEIDRMNAKNNKLVEMEDALVDIGLAMDFDFKRDATGGYVRGIDELTAVANRAQPAMDALGYTVEGLSNMEWGARQDAIDRIVRWTENSETAAGRTRNFAHSVADLGREALSTAQSASQMSMALEALLKPELDAEAATDAWHESLKALQEELKSGAGFKGFTDAAMSNRQVTRDYVTSSMERLTALAGVSTTTERDMARAVAQTRSEFIRSGIAAGFSRREIVKRANDLNLTPRLVKTVFRNVGITEAVLRGRELRDTFEKLPKNVRTAIKADGIPTTKEQVNDLVRRYELTEKQRTALLRIKDLASQPIGNILEKLGIVDQTHASATVTVASNAAAIAAETNAILSRIPDEIVAIHTVRSGPGGTRAGYDGPADGGTILGAYPRFTKSWDGSTVPRTGRGYQDRHPYLLADGEEVVSDRYGQASAYRPVLKAINRGDPPLVVRGMLAGGGTARYGSSLVTAPPSVTVRQQSAALPDRLTLVVDGHSFTAYVRQQARPVARREITKDATWRRRSDDRD